jgi:hypothetical protein
MGNKSSHDKKEEDKKGFFAIGNNYQTLDEVQDALRKAGLESSNRT